MPSSILSFFKNPAVHKLLLLALTVSLYSWIANFPAALLLIFAVYTHELGHALVTKYMGGKVYGIYLIPLFGGVCIPEETDMSSIKTFFCLYGGPFVSLLEAVGSWALFWYSGFSNPVYCGLSLFFTLVLTINILPAYPLDGGQMLSHILDPWHPALEVMVRLVLPGAGAILFITNGMFLIGAFCLVGVLSSLVELLRTVKTMTHPKNYAVPFYAYLLEMLTLLAGAFERRDKSMTRIESLGCLLIYGVTGFLCWLSFSMLEAYPLANIFLKDLFTR